MTYRSDHYPEEMSGGEMQRVAIARALVAEPEAVLCDEPTGNLDSATSKEILALLRRLPEPGKRSVVMVTHDRRAAEYGDRVVHIRDGVVALEEPLVRNLVREGIGPNGLHRERNLQADIKGSAMGVSYRSFSAELPCKMRRRYFFKK